MDLTKDKNPIRLVESPNMCLEKKKFKDFESNIRHLYSKDVADRIIDNIEKLRIYK